MKHLPAASHDWDQRVGYSKRVFLTSEELGVPGLHVQAIRIRPGERAAEHHHRRQTEIFYFPRANGRFAVNGKQIDLRDGDVLVIEPGDVHAVENPSSDVFIYVAFKHHYEEGDTVADA